MHRQIPKILEDKKNIGSILLIAFGFSLPLSVAINNFFAISLIMLWIYQKKYYETWQLIKQSKVLISGLIFYSIHILGLIWTEDLTWGLHILKKEWFFLLLPIIMSFTKKEHIGYYISAFLLAMSISEILSYLVWLEIISPILHATTYDPTPFMSHISYNPFLAFSIYLIGYFVLFDKTLSKTKKILMILFFITMSINMFITGGRAGQVGYIVVIFVLFAQYFDKNLFKSLILSTLLLSFVFTMAYYNSRVFNDRINLVVSNIKEFDQNKNTSVGLRMNFAINTWEIIKNDPFIGVGTGDFKKSYEKVNVSKSPEAISTVQPHNMYLLEMTQFGLLGLFSLMYIFYTQLSFSHRETDMLKSKIGMALPMLFLVIMLSDSYLLGHFSTMLFVYFSAFLYKETK